MIQKISIAVLAVIFLSSCSKRTLEFMIDAPESPMAPTEITFTDQSEGFEEVWWTFGDGAESTDSIATHKYYLSGRYPVTLTGRKGKKTKSLSKEVVISAPDKCLVEIETNYGNMLVQLYDDTPLHRDNFLKLAEEGFYDSLLFHRVINGFMIQGGDPQSKGAAPNVSLGSGGPGYQIDAEFLPNHAHIKGALSAARMGDAVNPQKRSSGSQFYIVHGRAVREGDLKNMEYQLEIDYPEEVEKKYLEFGGTPFLDQNYTVFGQVLEGLEVIDAIAAVKTNRSDRPMEDVYMIVRVIK